jgi:hypothetical protein
MFIAITFLLQDPGIPGGKVNSHKRNFIRKYLKTQFGEMRRAFFKEFY